MNVVVIRGPGQEMVTPLRRDPYTMEVDKGRNCYACGGFVHMARHCQNRGGRITEGRRLEYNGRREGLYKHKNHLKEEENSETLGVIRREYEQTLGLGLVDKNRTVGNY